MKIIISGGTGFVGSALVEHLSKKHQCFVITRNPKLDYHVSWDEMDLINCFKDADILIHASGQSIASGFWTKSFKKKLIDSRVETGEKLKNAILNSEHKLSRVIQFSGIGYYGNRANDELTEESSEGEGFMVDLAKKWESVLKDERLSHSHHILRIGIVIGDGGLLEKIKLPTKLGLGTSFGNGKQFISWISLKDLVSAINHIVHFGEQEIYNCVCPNPLRAKKFYRSISKAFNRPCFLFVPSFILKLLPGKMGEDIFLASQKVIPKSLQDEDFEFQDIDLLKTIKN